MVAATVTRDEVCAALTKLCQAAKREPRVIAKFTSDKPTRWDLAHIRINTRLDQYEAVTRDGA